MSNLCKTAIFQKDEFTEEQEKAFLAWIRTLPSVLNGNLGCESCHVLSVAHGAGKGHKPRLFAVPMTHKQHLTQTNEGYAAALAQHAKREVFAKFLKEYRIEDGNKAALAWFKERAMEHRVFFLANIWGKA